MRKLFSKAVAFGLIASTSLLQASYADIASTVLPAFDKGVSTNNQGSVGGTYFDTFNAGKDAKVNVEFTPPNQTSSGINANTLPVFDKGTNVDVTVNGQNNMNIQIQGGRNAVGEAYWNSFNIGKDAKVNVEFTQANQTSLNKVNASGGMSQIYGQFTNSSIGNKGYESTGKVILLNPNGVVFGDGANVNLNSFTASTLEGTYDKTNKKLLLTSGTNPNASITIGDGAQIYGDKGVAFASNNINAYKGSQISTRGANGTNTAYTGNSYGKVKLVTSDGVNFSYYTNGGVSGDSNLVDSSKTMKINLNGNINAGHIDVKNASTDANSSITLDGSYLSTIKATSGTVGGDGNISLVSNNDINTNNSSIYSNGGNVTLTADKNINTNDSKISSNNGNVKLTSNNGNIYAAKSDVFSTKDTTLTADKDIILNDTIVDSAANAKLTSKANIMSKNSQIAAVKNVNIKANDNILADNSSVTSALGYAKLNASNGSIDADKLNVSAYKDVTLTAKENVTLLNNSYPGISGPYIQYDAAESNIANIPGDNAPIYYRPFNSDNALTSYNGNVKVTASNGKIEADNINVNATKDVVFKSEQDLNIGGGYNGVMFDYTAPTQNIAPADAQIISGPPESAYFRPTSIKAGENVTLNSSSGKIKVDEIDIKAGKNVNVTSKEWLCFQDNNVESVNLNLKSSNNSVSAYSNYISADNDVNMTAKQNVHLGENNIKATRNVNAKASNGDINAYGNSVESKRDVTFNAKNTLNLGGNKIIAYNNANLKSKSKNISGNNTIIDNVEVHPIDGALPVPETPMVTPEPGTLSGAIVEPTTPVEEPVPCATSGMIIGE